MAGKSVGDRVPMEPNWAPDFAEVDLAVVGPKWWLPTWSSEAHVEAIPERN